MMVLSWAELHNPPGSIGGRQAAYSAMRSHVVVVVAPVAQQLMSVHGLAKLPIWPSQLKLPAGSELLLAGDRVTIGSQDQSLYRIVHISEQKARVCPLRDGTPRIIRTGELRFIEAPTQGMMLN